MSYRKVTLTPGEYYHIYNRGNSKQKIFHNTKDYERFIKLLYICNSNQNFKFRDIEKKVYEIDRGNTIVSIGSYCLMSNHFHLMLKEISEGGISKFMQKLTTAYSMYYNTKYERTGSLFEGKFKSEHLANDRYLKYIFSYIHLNPLKIIDKEWKEKGLKNKSGALEFLNKYKFSSYLDYQEINRSENSILQSLDFPEYFPTKESFNHEISDWISYTD